MSADCRWGCVVVCVAVFHGLLPPPCLGSQPGNSAPPKKVVFVAGVPSHGYGAHEHNAGCLLLSRSLQTAVPDVDVVVYHNGWPQDEHAFDDADTIVMYCDGGDQHPVNQHLDQIDALAKRGVGVVCIHYAVEVPKGPSGQRFLDWIGGYFETYWSVNPHWTAEFSELPVHEITRGVKPFSINDEWYYHMRFREGMQGVTPILSAIPPASTLSHPDGPHSGNPAVRQEAGLPQHVAWAAERPGGGRGFGFTGGHFHWNWGDPNFRKLMLNAILWTAHHEVPPQGVSDRPVTLEDLEANQDFEAPKDFNREEIKARLQQASASKERRNRGRQRAARAAAKPAYASPIVTAATPGKQVAVSAPLGEAKSLYLVVEDGGDGFSCDWADWAEPRLTGPAGELKLTGLKWKAANCDWGQVQINKNAGGGPLRIDGRAIDDGIGTHAHSVIQFDIPPGYDQFSAMGGLDNGGTDQGGGAATSVRFLVYTQAPPRGPGGGTHDPEQAVANLDVAPGLEATLFASEPELLSLTNLDVDYRGRVWVCEVVNYRGHNGKRGEGDRILILDDTDQDGVADKVDVYYQGRDVDSAMGICVLGNQVIVSCSPNVLLFTDEDGDDKPDRKEVLFSNTGQPQHDHSAHSFVFGPDGKLYWNFGNTGKAVHDRDGHPVLDALGRPVVDNGHPYHGGMVFRCDLDGSHFEVLAHNFRNNYEVAVDAFGDLWQSDNDDDGNRGVRINYVLQHGNYGYLDELTGAGWRTPRTGMNPEVPLQHWHQNDPGVIPNLLQTGAGSPTGILVYEGRLLPEVFWDQVIHCDAGPNIVRAYPVRQQGAGYHAEVVNILYGARDNWFRPADVCVAPDGSLLVTDWYDPGVGGHAMGDLDRGRLFRVAPPGMGYHMPAIDYESPPGAAEALGNPNGDVRYRAWQALVRMGDASLPALEKVYHTSDRPRHRARALWLLAKLTNDDGWSPRAATDADEDLRRVALRIRQESDGDVLGLVSSLVNDPAVSVRRDCALALYAQQGANAAELWAQLAAAHDGHDRWYLEALGIGASHHWDACLNAWLERVGDRWNEPPGRDIVWRSRAGKTPELLGQLIREGLERGEDVVRYLRAFDFQPSGKCQAILSELAFGALPGGEDQRAMVIGEAVKRLTAGAVGEDSQRLAALNRWLDRVRGSEQFVDLVRRFNLEQRFDDLLHMAATHPSETSGIEAVKLLLDWGRQPQIAQALSQAELAEVLGLTQALANAADGRAAALLLPMVTDSRRDDEVRRQATRGLGKSRSGAQQLLELAQADQLDDVVKPAASLALNSVAYGEIRQAAATLLPAPPDKDNQPLPVISELLNRRGDYSRGQFVFQKTGQCANCHKLDDPGKEVGPSLAEIGGKLSREALYESIVYPSAGIAHSYENYAVQTVDGTILTGLIISRDDQQIVLRNAEAITQSIKIADIEEIKKQPISLMPADVHKTMSTEQLVDLVEYLVTLRKK